MFLSLPTVPEGAVRPLPDFTATHRRPRKVLALERLILAMILWGWLLPLPAVYGQGSLRIDAADLGLFDPVSRPLVLNYQLMEPAREVELLVFDFKGAVVDRQVAVGLRAGRHAFTWAGFSETDRPLPDGRYRLLLRARFPSDLQEEKVVTVRLAAKPFVPDQWLPEPLPLEAPAHRIWGRWAGFWQRDPENPDATVANEQRVVLGVAYRTPQVEGDGIFDYRHRDPGSDDLDGSSAAIEKRWTTGSAAGSFRRGLGTLDDPLVLFSDFRTEYRKAGLQMHQSIGESRLQVAGFTAEGDTETRETGGVVRWVSPVASGFELGATGTVRRAKLEDDAGRRGEAVGALDVSWEPPLPWEGRLFAETAVSKGPDQRKDIAAIAGGRFQISPNARLGLSGIHLGRDFTAAFSDPLRDVQSDVWGGVVDGELTLPGRWRAMGPATVSCRGYGLKRHSSGDTVAEVDAAVRSELDSDTTLVVSGFVNRDGADTVRSGLLAVDRRWHSWFKNRFEGAFTDSGSTRTTRFRLDAELSDPDRGIRGGLEWLSRDTDSGDSIVSRELTLFADGWLDGWRTNGFARINRRDGTHGLNLFGKVEKRIEWLHRYRLTGYAAFGSRSAFKTTEQVEVGLEVAF